MVGSALVWYFSDLFQTTDTAATEVTTDTSHRVFRPFPPATTAMQFSNWCNLQLSSLTKRKSQLEATDPTVTNSDVAFLDDFDQLLIEMRNLGGVSGLYENVHPAADLRAAADICSKKLNELVVSISLSRAVYDQLQTIDQGPLDHLAQRHLERLLRDYRRSGVALDAELRDRVRNLQTEIHALGQSFTTNINQSRKFVEIKDHSELKGLPEDYLAAHPADQRGIITISTDYPDILPVLQYADSDQLRFRLYHQFLNRATPENHRVLESLLDKRWQLARLLGFDNYADYEMESKMIGSAARAHDFIDRVDQLARQRSDREYQLLLNRLKQQQPAATEVGNWQKSWLKTRIQNEQYGLNPLEVRRYFPYSRVRDGIFQLVRDMFGIELRPWQTQTWDDEVEAYQIYEGKQLLGYIYLDMHPRPGKYSHAAHFGLQSGIRDKQLPAAVLVCNFPRATDPAGGLMEHGQVETFLHEFGHLLHSLFAGNQPWSSLSGIATEDDFVEVPSQMLEEWVWDYPTLKTFAVNEQGQSIPRQLVDRMNAARHFGHGVWIRNQLFYASLALDFYRTAPDQLDLNGITKSRQQHYSPFAYIEDTAFYNSFGHLYGYGASYYTYMWSLVIAADLFSEFKANGLHDTATARRFRDLVLTPGGSKDASQLVADFLGRPYNFKAFENQLNSTDNTE